MSKINTAEIKKTLDNKFGKNKYIRLKKRKFEYFNSRINFNGNNDIILNGKLNYRIFTDDSDELIYVIDDNKDILYIEEGYPQLPTSCFVANVSFNEKYNSVAIFINLKEEYSESFSEYSSIEEEIRLETIAGLFEAFKEKSLSITNEQEGLFFVTKINDNNDECIEFCKNILKEIKIKVE